MRNLNWFLCLSLLAGCAAEYSPGAASSEVRFDSAAPTMDAEPSGNEADLTVADQAASETTIKPRIIYTAEVRVVADDFAIAAEAVGRLVEESSGYVATASLDRRSGSSRFGEWTIRVPVEQYEAFLSSLDSIGFVESRSQSSQDVTMEYVDVEARITNLQRLEERFVKLLDERTGKLEDVLHIEQELARVRGDIEQAQGRLRYLSNRTSYSTVTLTIREQKDYVPPKAPSFGEQIARTWSQSLEALQGAGEIAVLVVVAVTPWLLIASIPVIAIAATIRQAMKRRRLGAKLRT